MRRLMRKLGVPLYAATGLLELVWNLTSTEAPQGNIGKIDDEDIADKVGWDDPAATLIDALVDAGWLDRDDHYRLLVHDWPEHAENNVHTTLARQCLTFADGTIPKSGGLNKYERDRFNEWLERGGQEKREVGRPKNQPKCSADSDESSRNADKKHVPSQAMPSHAMPSTPLPPTGGPGLSPLTAGDPSPTVDLSVMNRVLCEKVGIFDIRQQSDMHRMFDSYLRHHAGVSMGDAVEHMHGRWQEYQRAGPELKFRYGSAHRFFMSGIWDKPDAWERKDGTSNGRAGPKEPCPVIESKDSRETAAWFAAKAREKQQAGKPLTEIERNLLAADA